jgi:hypothetical protein
MTMISCLGSYDYHDIFISMASVPAPATMDISNISRQMIGFLLQKPKKWTSEHIRTLNVEEKGTISAAEMVGQKNLPDEGDQGVFLNDLEYQFVANRSLRFPRPNSAVHGTNKRGYLQNPI